MGGVLDAQTGNVLGLQPAYVGERTVRGQQKEVFDHDGRGLDLMDKLNFGKQDVLIIAALNARGGAMDLARSPCGEAQIEASPEYQAIPAWGSAWISVAGLPAGLMHSEER
jgi:hypothetical protein